MYIDLRTICLGVLDEFRMRCGPGWSRRRRDSGLLEGRSGVGRTAFRGEGLSGIESGAQGFGYLHPGRVQEILAARITARDSQDDKITIKIDHMTPSTTKLRIRVSTFGDEIKSQRIYLRIRQNL